MPIQNNNDLCSKAVLSVSEHVQQLGMSRGQFYLLLAEGFFWPPVYALRNRRAFYTKEIAQQNMIARMTGEGVDGTPRVFYRRRNSGSGSHTEAQSGRSRNNVRRRDQHGELVATLKGLGVEANSQTVGAALSACFPEGYDDMNQSDIIRAVFRHLRSSQSA